MASLSSCIQMMRKCLVMGYCLFLLIPFNFTERNQGFAQTVRYYITPVGDSASLHIRKSLRPPFTTPAFVIRAQTRFQCTCCYALHCWRDTRLSCSFFFSLIIFAHLLSVSGFHALRTALTRWYIAWILSRGYCSSNSRKICTKQDTAHKTPRK